LYWTAAAEAGQRTSRGALLQTPVSDTD
jgi:hypothetical protein